MIKINRSKIQLQGILLGAMLSIGSAAVAQTLPSYQTDSPWFTEGEALVQAKVAAEVNTAQAKNVILFVGDGMGISTLTASRIFEGQSIAGNEGGEEHALFFESFPHTALAKTYNTNQQTPDSAGTMTAMMSGVKTKAGVIGVNETVLRSSCLSSLTNELHTALEYAEMQGKSTGIVTTARLTHATPAATYAHSPERNWETDSELPQEAIDYGCKDIAAQLIEFPYGDGIEVAMGGGRRNFLPNDVEDGEGSAGRRADGRDLTAEWLDSSDNAAYVWNQEGFDGVNTAETTRLLGLFNSSHMQYEQDRAMDTGGEPSLSEMTGKAIEILDNNQDGFFLMVESGRIDHAHHAGNAYRALVDTVAFAAAVQTAYENTDPAETLIIVTADHSHVFTIAGYPTRGNPILGLVVGNDSSGAPNAAPELDLNDMPYTTVGYTNGLGFASAAGGDVRYDLPADPGRKDLTSVDVEDPDFHQEALVPLESETHSGEDISIHATGPGAHLFYGVVEQSVVFHVINKALGLGAMPY